MSYGLFLSITSHGIVVYGLLLTVLSSEIDLNGYLLYCPCMGRFGNQGDHFLGSLAFAHGLNRTLALPPWVVYPSKPVATSDWFQVSSLQKYHRVMPMEYFMDKLAPEVWPPGKRKGFCYGEPGNDCPMKRGNPFGPFWDRFGVDFDDSVTYTRLSFSTHHNWVRDEWNRKFPPKDYPVLAFMGAPAAFPVAEENKWLQKYLKWSPAIIKRVQEFINRELPSGAWIGIHLRNGIDWVRACEHADGITNMMASPQCLGYQPAVKLTRSLCLPSKQDVLKEVKKLVKSIKAKGVFVATDSDPMLKELREHLKALKMKVSVVTSFGGHDWSPQLDLAILGQADHFIGNCVSSFTAFVVREREAAGKPSSFFAFPKIKVGAKVEL